MKDEELFKAWKSEQYKDQSTEERFEFVEHLHTFPKYFEKTFLAGLKAGRPQWHDLRKDPNDLPEKMGLGSKEVYVAYENGVTDFACYRFDKKIWERSEDGEQAVGVIAWCEIPTFDKE